VIIVIDPSEFVYSAEYAGKKKLREIRRKNRIRIVIWLG